MYKYLLKKIYSFPSPTRKLILIVCDTFIIVYGLKLSLSATKFANTDNLNSIYLIAIAIATLINIGFGQYINITIYNNSKGFYKLIYRNFIIVILFYIFSSLNKEFNYSFEQAIIFFTLISSGSASLRLFIKDLLLKNMPLNNLQKKRVAIYGAGSAGSQLAASLELNPQYTLIKFIDDSNDLEGKELRGIQIIKPNNIYKFKHQIDQILIAIPSLNRDRKLEIIDLLNKQKIPILKIPSLNDIVSGTSRIDKLMPIDIEDLLYRKKIKLSFDNFDISLKNSVICITGAGGSIGSELARQILKLKPKKLILIEKNELALYNINCELLEDDKNTTKIKSVLGDCSNYALMMNVFKKEKIEILFHAAAYKHVPLVENNPLTGIQNNVISTLTACKVSQIMGVKKFILISSDKAVRPENIMGASKRLSEIIVKAFANEQQSLNSKSKTSFSMVRFGNVLNSSGSVVPLFKKQISNGGPITITHPEIIRYFMTISEAVELVIISSIFAKGGEVFLLDMGEPVKIYDLAKKMINLSGLTLKDDSNPSGDIQIIYSGLRPGEKLFEELLINGNSLSTKHPLIFYAEEEGLPSKFLWPKIDRLKKALNEYDEILVLNLLKDLLPAWNNKNNLT